MLALGLFSKLLSACGTWLCAVRVEVALEVGCQESTARACGTSHHTVSRRVLCSLRALLCDLAFSQAFSAQGMPTNHQVYKDADPVVVRWKDLKDHLRCGGLRLHACCTAARNVC